MMKREANFQKLALKLLRGRRNLSEDEQKWEARMQKRFARKLYRLPVAQWSDYLLNECPHPWEKQICSLVVKGKKFLNGSFIREITEMTEPTQHLITQLYLAGLKQLALLDTETFNWWFERVPTKAKLKSFDVLAEHESGYDHRQIPGENFDQIVKYALKLDHLHWRKLRAIGTFGMMRIFELAIEDPKYRWKALKEILPTFQQLYMPKEEDRAKFNELKAKFDTLFGANHEDDDEEEKKIAFVTAFKDDSDGVDDWDEESDVE